MTTLAAAKAGLRRTILARRRALDDGTRRAERAALAEARLPGLPATVCAYWPVGTEPGSTRLLDDLRARGCRVLLPVVEPDNPDGPLDWSVYSGADGLADGPLGLLEPVGPRLGVEAIGEASLLLVPALAVDRDGWRLGRGGGFYDRSLPMRRPDAIVVAVVRDEEILDEVPHEPHDVRVRAAVTPGAGFVWLTPG